MHRDHSSGSHFLFGFADDQAPAQEISEGCIGRGEHPRAWQLGCTMDMHLSASLEAVYLYFSVRTEETLDRNLSHAA